MPLASRSGSAWAQITLPEVLLLGERLCRDVRREALCHIPGIRALRLNHLLWVQRYGAAAQTGWRVGFGLWRFVRAALNPIQSAGQEPSGMIAEKTLSVLSLSARLRDEDVCTRDRRAAIDLYSGRLALSDDEVRAAQARDAAGTAAPIAPVRIVLIGQVNAGKSCLLNAFA